MGVAVRIRGDLRGQDMRLLASYLRSLIEQATGTSVTSVNVVGDRTDAAPALIQKA